MADTSELEVLARELGAWMHDSAWPTWWQHARCKNGAFFEALDFDGVAVESKLSRVRTQARQIYSFALAYRSGWRTRGLGVELDASIIRFRDSCLRPDGLAGKVVDIQSGELADDTADLYDTAFWLLALAECRNILGQNLIDREIERLLVAVDAGLAYPGSNGYREQLPPSARRRQNPHMHFFESLLCLYEKTGNPDVRARADALLDFIRRSFFCFENGFVAEEVNERSGLTSKSFEPGHSMEWVWLLGYRSRLFGVDLDGMALALYERVVGLDLEFDRCPLLLSTADSIDDLSCRLWSQTECLKAHLCMAELGPSTGRAAARRRAIDCAQAIADNWLSSVHPGGWLDHFDADRNLVAKNMPASTGYHLYLAFSELLRIANGSPARP